MRIKKTRQKEALIIFKTSSQRSNISAKQLSGEFPQAITKQPDNPTADVLTWTWKADIKQKQRNASSTITYNINLVPPNCVFKADEENKRHIYQHGKVKFLLPDNLIVWAENSKNYIKSLPALMSEYQQDGGTPALMVNVTLFLLSSSPKIRR